MIRITRNGGVGQTVSASELSPADARILTGIHTEVKRTTVQTLTNDTETALSWEAEVYDTNDLWVVGSPTVFTVPYAGRWLVYCHVEWDTDADGYRMLMFRVNGGNLDETRVYLQPATTATILTGQTITSVLNLAANDTVSVRGRHTAGANLTISAANCRFGAVYLGA